MVERKRQPIIKHFSSESLTRISSEYIERMTFIRSYPKLNKLTTADDINIAMFRQIHSIPVHQSLAVFRKAKTLYQYTLS